MGRVNTSARDRADQDTRSQYMLVTNSRERGTGYAYFARGKGPAQLGVDIDFSDRASFAE